MESGKKIQRKTIIVLGGDGYLGWSLGLAFASRTDWNVVLVDSLIKREWEKTANAKLLVPFKEPLGRVKEFKRIFGKNNLSFEKTCLLDDAAVSAMIKKYRPFAVVNAAQQPSAPFAMMNAKNAAVTFQNNIAGHLNVLWAIAEIDKSINYIKLGSAGCYMGVDTDLVPLQKNDFSFKHGGKVRKILNSWMPMYATDFYHQSKITDFLINDMCAETWNLKVLTVQQSTIFGATIAENRPLKNRALSARFNYDAVFSTVLNRFVCQLAIGHPLTVYGDGNQKTGIISLSDTVDNFMKFATMDLEPGKHAVAHNYTHRLSIRQIAKALIEAAGKGKIEYLDNPRKEGKGVLEKEMEVHPLVRGSHAKKDEKFKSELADLLEFVNRHKNRIDRSIILPKVFWSK